MSRQAILVQGDCMRAMRRLPDLSVGLTLTDIPYGEVNRQSGGLRNLDKGKADNPTFSLPEWLAETVRVTYGSVYVFCGIEQVSYLRAGLANYGFTTRLCVWEKTNPSPMNGQHIWLSGVECCVFGKRRGGTFNLHCKNTVWRFPTARSKNHPTQKPLALMEYLIAASTNPGDKVLDSCMGSGTTGVAAVRLGRRFIGMELDEGYFKLAQDRINAEIEASAQLREVKV